MGGCYQSPSLGGTGHSPAISPSQKNTRRGSGRKLLSWSRFCVKTATPPSTTRSLEGTARAQGGTELGWQCHGPGSGHAAQAGRTAGLPIGPFQPSGRLLVERCKRGRAALPLLQPCDRCGMRFPAPQGGGCLAGGTPAPLLPPL